MIIASTQVDVQDNLWDEAMAVAIAVQHEAVKAEGCVSFRFFADIENPTVLHSFEEWVSEEALTQSMAAPYMQRFYDILNKIGEDRVTTKSYVTIENTAVG